MNRNKTTYQPVTSQHKYIIYFNEPLTSHHSPHFITINTPSTEQKRLNTINKYLLNQNEQIKLN